MTLHQTHGPRGDERCAQEPSTCQYVMTVQTPRLCNHPGFNVFKPPVAHILCRITDSDAEARHISASDSGLPPRFVGRVIFR